MFTNQMQGYSFFPFQILRSHSQNFSLQKSHNIISPIQESKEPFAINMLNSPDTKINLDNLPISKIKGRTKLFSPNIIKSNGNLKTSSSNSNESLTTNSNSYNRININHNKNNIKPFTLVPNLYNINNINRNYNNNSNCFLLQRNISMNNLVLTNQYNRNNLFGNNINNKTLFSNSLNRNEFLEENKNKNKSINYYNKFNSIKEYTSENTVILTLKIKVSKNDYRIFNLKKYDDLFISLQKFFDLNQIKPSLIKPIVTKILLSLNKIFWVLNSKIGNYDQEYLSSLYKLWLKNGKKIPINNNNNDSISSNDSNSPFKNKSFQNENENSFEKTKKKKSKSI